MLYLDYGQTGFPRPNGQGVDGGVLLEQLHSQHQMPWGLSTSLISHRIGNFCFCKIERDSNDHNCLTGPIHIHNSIPYLLYLRLSLENTDFYSATQFFFFFLFLFKHCKEAFKNCSLLLPCAEVTWHRDWIHTNLILSIVFLALSIFAHYSQQYLVVFPFPRNARFNTKSSHHQPVAYEWSRVPHWHGMTEQGAAVAG